MWLDGYLQSLWCLLYSKTHKCNTIHIAYFTALPEHCGKLKNLLARTISCGTPADMQFGHTSEECRWDTAESLPVYASSTSVNIVHEPRAHGILSHMH